MAVEHLLEDAGRKRRVRRLVVTILLGVLALHVAAGLVAGAFVVARYLQPPPATFEVKRDLRIEDQQRQHAMNMAALDSLAPKPSFSDKLQSLRPGPIALPELPKVPMDQMLPLDPAEIVSDQVSSIVGAAGLGAGARSGATGDGGTGDAISFLGIETHARRVLILYDVASSVMTAAARAGFPLERVRDETKTLLAGVGVNTRFGLGQFARNYAFFAPELLPASAPNRARAEEWLDRWFATDGTMPRGTPGLVSGSPGFLELLRAAFQLEPDVIFILSDGSFERGSGSANARIPWPEVHDTLRELQKSRPNPVQIHFIGVGMKPENQREIRRAIATHGGGGRFRELK